MKIILTLILCSFSNGQCLTPYTHPITFDNYYDCLNAGYQESLLKSKMIGKEKVNEDGLFVRFACTEEKKQQV